MADRIPLQLDDNLDISKFLPGDTVPIANGGTGAVDVAGARANLSLTPGTDVQGYDPDLAAIAALSGTGFPVRTAADTWAQRSLAAPAAGFTISNPAGVAGNPTFALSNDLAALEGLSGTGLAVRSAADTWLQRSVAGTAGRITVANGDGVSGNPTLDLATLSDSGAGTFLKIARDSYGRVSGTTAVVQADLTGLLGTYYLPTAGGTMTGNLTLFADPTSAMHPVTKQYADALAAGTIPRLGVKAMATANVNIANPGTAVFDGVTMSNGESLLLAFQSTGSQNGVYVFNGSGSAMTRRPDYDTSPEVNPGDTFFVDQGTLYADTSWTLITNAPITLGTTALVYTQTSGLGQITAGAGLTKTGNTLDVGTASSGRIVVNADNIDLASGIVTPGTYTKVTVDTYGRVTTGATATPGDIGAQTASSELTGLAALSANGMVTRTAAGTYASRTLTAPAAGFTITNPAGTAGNPTFALADDLAAVEGLSGTGLAVRTASNTWANRQVTSSGGRLTVTNPAGIAGDINVDLTSGVASAGTYYSVTVDTYGRVTGGSTSPLASAEYSASQLTNASGSTVAIGRAVYASASGSFNLARADAVGTRKITGLVAAVSIANGAQGQVATAGTITATTGQWDAVTGQSGGLTTDAYYYLSNSTAGNLTTTAPSTGWLVRVGKALSTTQMRIMDGNPIRLT